MISKMWISECIYFARENSIKMKWHFLENNHSVAEFTHMNGDFTGQNQQCEHLYCMGITPSHPEVWTSYNSHIMLWSNICGKLSVIHIHTEAKECLENKKYQITKKIETYCTLIMSRCG